MHSSVAYISASAELRVMTHRQQDTQWSGLLKIIIKPEIERVEKRGSSRQADGVGRD